MEDKGPFLETILQVRMAIKIMLVLKTKRRNGGSDCAWIYPNEIYSDFKTQTFFSFLDRLRKRGMTKLLPNIVKEEYSSIFRLTLKGEEILERELRELFHELKELSPETQ